MANTAQTRPYEPTVIAADTLTGDKVVNLNKEDLGKIEHLMIDLASGRVAYAVLSSGGNHARTRNSGENKGRCP
jgi:sporulation protein YlmC with PRC-barrel domain